MSNPQITVSYDRVSKTLHLHDATSNFNPCTHIECYPTCLLHNDDDVAHKIENLIFDRLAKKTYCANKKTDNHLEPKDLAISKKYLSINNQFCTSVLIFDLDYECSSTAWFECGLPPPNIVVVNPENSHSQLFYILQNPIFVSKNSYNKNSENYMNDIINTMQDKLNADKGFSNRLAKNPFHPAWYSMVYCVEPYTLADLHKALGDLIKKPKKSDTVVNLLEGVSLGRNCALFDEVRQIAYATVFKYSQYDLFYDFIYDVVDKSNNTLEAPLPLSEVRSISKSIASWTWDNYSGRSCKDKSKYEKTKHQSVDKYLPFRVRQSIKGTLGNKYGKACNKGGKARSAKYDDKRQQARDMHYKGYSNGAIARHLGVSKTTVGRWLKSEVV